VNQEEPCSVFWTRSYGVATVAKSLLEAEQIEYVVRNEGLNGLFSGLDVDAGPIELWVRVEDGKSAREILKDLAETK
jgi:Putative prokaryotic signal transducing protein